MSIHIMGIGEITTTIEVRGNHWGKLHPEERRWMRLAYKRMPAFQTEDAAQDYIRIHNLYQDMLAGLGINAPRHDNLVKRRPDGRWTVYNRQERLPTHQVACLVIRDLDREGCMDLFSAAREDGPRVPAQPGSAGEDFLSRTIRAIISHP